VNGFDLAEILRNPEYAAMLVHGIEMTFVIYIGSWLLAMALALILLCIRFAPFRFGNSVVAAYVSYHRNVPTLVQLMLWYFGIFTLLPDWLTSWLAVHNAETIFAVIGLGLCQAAYFSEDLRSGLRSVSPGQMEAATALGHGYLSAMRFVVMPGRAQRAAAAHQSQCFPVQEQQPRHRHRRPRTDACREGNRKPELPHLRDLPRRHGPLPVLLATDHERRRLSVDARRSGKEWTRMIADLIAIVKDYWLLLLIGQYPNGPLGGLANTLILSALSIALAFPVSILLALARLSKWRSLRWPVTALVYVTRGVPLLMLILWSYFLVPLLTGADVPSFVTMLTTLVVYQGAFLSEVVRAGIVALGHGQMDAARALGHSYLGAMRYIILPQALYNMIPSIISTFVSTIKDTTLGYVINVPDLTFAASQVNNQLLTQPFQVFLILAVVYYAICWSLTHVANVIERRITRKRAGLSSDPEPSSLAPAKILSEQS
jgi:polar amino acid transport system permease protein